MPPLPEDDPSIDDEVVERDAETPLPPPGHGGKLRLDLNSEIDDQTLEVGAYAKGLSRFIAEAKGDFSFALFGGWGRGKTLLSRLICAELEQTGSHIPVFVNGWKYNEGPAVWAHLYEQILAAIIEADRPKSRKHLFGWDWCGRLSLGFRSTLVRSGPFHIAVVLLFSLLSLIPISFLLNFVLFLASLIGTAWLATAVSLGRKYSTIRRAFLAGLLSPKSQREFLGEEDSIERDIGDLLVAACPRGAFGRPLSVCIKILAVVGAAAGISVLLLVGSTAGIETAPKWLTESLPDGSDGRLQFAIGIWWLLCVVIVGAVLSRFRGRTSLLLVLDDLDRCSSKELLRIVEGMKLMLQDQRIAARVKLLVVVEKDRLADAIYDRFLRPDVTAEDMRTTVVEHINKLFSCQFQMLDISVADAKHVAESYLNATRKEPRWVPPPNAPRAASEVVFTPAEESEIVKAVEDLHQRCKTYFKSPRSIRLFVVRYQLVRVLLDSLEVRWNVQDVMQAFTCVATGTHSDEVAAEIHKVVRQVEIVDDFGLPLD